MLSDRQRDTWPFVEITAPEEAADDLGAELMDLGSTGIEQRDEGGGRVTLVAYFDTTPDVEDLASVLAVTPGVDPETARHAAASIRLGSTPDDDWLRIWKRGFEPAPIGSRLLVFPSWKREQAESFTGRVGVEIDPGQAFGTGTHETTRMCLEWLDAAWTGKSLLDVGTGTGILAIAAIRLVPDACVAAVDVDPLAIEVAVENAEINGVSGKIRFETCGAEDIEGVFDVVLANLTADVIIATRDDLIARIGERGGLVLSGILHEQAPVVIESMRAAGLLLEARSDQGEWSALVMRRP